MTLEDLKKISEIALFSFASVFIFLKLINEQLRCAMTVELKPERTRLSDRQDLVSVTVDLKHPKGWIQITDILLTIKEGVDGASAVREIRDNDRLLEHKTDNEKLLSQIGKNTTSIFPGGQIQIAYAFPVSSGMPIVVDAAVLGFRKGVAMFSGQGQWRASCVVPCQPSSSAANELP